MEELASENKEKLIDLLKERHTFECTGVKLYDRILERLSSPPELEAFHAREYEQMAVRLRFIRDAELEHAEWLANQIEILGGNPRKKSAQAYLVERESAGIEDIILHSAGSDIPALFHALLTAELADNAGWELLVALATEAQDDDARREFQRRHSEEQDHLRYVGDLVSRFTVRDVLPRHAAPVHV